PCLSHVAVCVGEKRERRGAVEALVAGREERADVAQPGCAEQRVYERVCEHIAVRVAGEPARMVELHPAEDERDARLERVCVDSYADTKIRHEAPLVAPRASGCGSLPAARRADTPTARGGRAPPAS